tara:strand:- start:1212 stop:1907 length:696 start_codon:yes stop_codon:yes gene_type:complete
MRLFTKLYNKFIKKIEKVVVFKPSINIKTIYLGSSYGGWHVVSDYLNSESIIYSLGIGKDITFDEECIKLFNCKIYAFDPTEATMEFLKVKKVNPNFKFFPYAISNENKLANFYPPRQNDYVSHTLETDIHASSTRPVKKVQVKTLSTIMKELGHMKIDVLKCDIEGTEYKVLDSILKDNIYIKQLCIEFHHQFEKYSRFKTKKMIKQLEHNNYRLVQVKSNTDFLFLKID